MKTENKYNLILWDWNGTLIDDIALCVNISDDMLTERGLPPHGCADNYREQFGFPVYDYYLRTGYTFENETFEAVSDVFVAKYEAGVKGCSLREGAAEALWAVHRAGIRQAIVSATSAARLKAQVTHFGLSELFEEILGISDELAAGKAHIAVDYLSRIKEDPRKVLMVGDTCHDFEVSRAVGCDCALICGGHQLPCTLETCGVPIFKNHIELIESLAL